MDDVRFQILRRTFGAPITTSSDLFRCAQAARELSEAGQFKNRPPEMTEKVRERLQQLMKMAERLGNFEANRASGLASKVLARLDADELAAKPKPYKLASFLADDLSPEDALHWWHIDAYASLAYALGFADISWGARPDSRDGKRLAQIEAIVDEIDSAGDDWLAAAQLWFDTFAVVRVPSAERVPANEIPDDAA
jgi:hypothetical protein